MRKFQLIIMAATMVMPLANASATASKSNIVVAAASTPDLSTLVAAVKAANLAHTLASKGPFTVFAPTNDAFSKLPAETVDTLLKPENRDKLTNILTYHVVPGRYSSKTILAAIQSGGGTATLKTVSGGKLTAAVQDGKVVLTDENGGTSTVTKADLMESNGIVHLVDSVVLPK